MAGILFGVNMKIELKELKKAVSWIEANSRDLSVNIISGDGSKLILHCFDKNDCEVEITLYTDNQMLPKIKKTEVLR